MGLFDDVRCEMPGPHKADGWQTKSLDDPYMRRVVITADGRVTVDGVEMPEFRGEVCFHDFVDRKWLEWSAIFIDGKCVSLVQIAP